MRWITAFLLSFTCTAIWHPKLANADPAGDPSPATIDQCRAIVRSTDPKYQQDNLFKVAPWLTQLASDPDPAVRIGAMKFTGLLPNDPAAAAIIVSAIQDSDANVRLAAIGISVCPKPDTSAQYWPV